MEADRKRVRADGDERRELGREAMTTKDEQRAARDGPDLQAVDGEAVVEARRAEAREQRVAETLRPAEHDRLDDRSTLAVQAVRAVGREPALQPVADAADPAAPADDAPLLGAQHDVDALAAKPRRFVEAVRRPARQLQDPDERKA